MRTYGFGFVVAALCCASVWAGPAPEVPKDLRVVVVQDASRGKALSAAVEANGWSVKTYAGDADGWNGAIDRLGDADILIANGAGAAFPTNLTAKLLAAVSNGCAFVAMGVDSAKALAPVAGVFPSGVELGFTPGKDGARLPAFRIEGASSIFWYPNYAKECAGAAGTLEVRGPMSVDAWGRGGRIFASARPGRGFAAVTTATFDTAKFLGNLGKLLELQRAGLAYRGGRYSPSFGESSANCDLANVSGTNIWMRAFCDLAMADGTTRRFWGDGGTREKNGHFGLTASGLFDVHGKGRLTFTVRNSRTGATTLLWDREVTFPDYLEIETPFYRSSVSTARRETAVRLALKANVFAERVAGRTAKVTMFAPDGTELAAADVAFTGANRVEFSLPLDRTAQPGTYRLQATLPLADGEGRATTEATFDVVGVKKEQVFVDQDGTILKGGAPWFPIGFYHVWPGEIDDVAETGADFIQFWDSHSTLGPTGTLARIASHGMKIVLEDGIWGQVVNSMNNPPELYPFENDPTFRAREEAIRDDPSGAIGMWYVADEPGRECISGMKRSNRHRREMDPDHPTFVCSTGDPTVGVADILGLDIYPRYNNCIQPLTRVSDAFDRASRHTNGRQCLILAGQAFGNKPMHGEEPEDVRAMAYLALTHGAKGIIWYTWHDGGNQGVTFHPATRKVCTDVIAEIRTFAPALAAVGTNRRGLSRDGKVHALLCGDDVTGRYLLLVNGDDDPSATELVMAELKNASFEPLFGAANASPDCDGSLRFEMPGRATAVYRVTAR